MIPDCECILVTMLKPSLVPKPEVRIDQPEVRFYQPEVKFDQSEVASYQP